MVISLYMHLQISISIFSICVKGSLVCKMSTLLPFVRQFKTLFILKCIVDAKRLLVLWHIYLTRAHYSGGIIVFDDEVTLVTKLRASMSICFKMIRWLETIPMCNSWKSISVFPAHDMHKYTSFTIFSILTNFAESIKTMPTTQSIY